VHDESAAAPVITVKYILPPQSHAALQADSEAVKAAAAKHALLPEAHAEQTPALAAQSIKGSHATVHAVGPAVHAEDAHQPKGQPKWSQAQQAEAVAMGVAAVKHALLPESQAAVPKPTESAAEPHGVGKHVTPSKARIGKEPVVAVAVKPPVRQGRPPRARRAVFNKEAKDAGLTDAPPGDAAGSDGVHGVKEGIPAKPRPGQKGISLTLHCSAK